MIILTKVDFKKKFSILFVCSFFRNLKLFFIRRLLILKRFLIHFFFFQFFEQSLHTFLGETLSIQIDIPFLLLPLNEVFLGMRTNLKSWSRSYALLDSFPVFSVQLDGVYELLMFLFCPSSIHTGLISFFTFVLFLVWFVKFTVVLHKELII